MDADGASDADEDGSTPVDVVAGASRTAVRAFGFGLGRSAKVWSVQENNSEELHAYQEDPLSCRSPLCLPSYSCLIGGPSALKV